MTRRTSIALLAVALLASLLSACTPAGAYRLYATFDDSGDLQHRGGVQVADVRVGIIDHIELTKDFKSRVTLRLNPGVRVPVGSVAVLRTTSLLGEKFVELRAPADVPSGTSFAALPSGADLGTGEEAPELEFIAQQAVEVLSGVVVDDLSTLVQAGAEGFGGKGAELHTLVQDLATVSKVLADRSDDIGRIIDGLAGATGTLAQGTQTLQTLLDDLAGASQALAANRQKAVDALAALSALARTGDDLVQRYRASVDKQLRQVDAILQEVNRNQGSLSLFVDWLAKFLSAVPLGTRGDFVQVFAQIVPSTLDCRSPGNAAGACGDAVKRPTP